MHDGPRFKKGDVVTVSQYYTGNNFEDEERTFTIAGVSSESQNGRWVYDVEKGNGCWARDINEDDIVWPYNVQKEKHEEWKKKNEPKPECDHIVGFYDSYDESQNITLSALSPSEYREACEWFRKYSSKDQRDPHTHHSFCCLCGDPIDWEAIEKQLNS